MKKTPFLLVVAIFAGTAKADDARDDLIVQSLEGLVRRIERSERNARATNQSMLSAIEKLNDRIDRSERSMTADIKRLDERVTRLEANAGASTPSSFQPAEHHSDRAAFESRRPAFKPRPTYQDDRPVKLSSIRSPDDVTRSLPDVPLDQFVLERDWLSDDDDNPLTHARNAGHGLANAISSGTAKAAGTQNSHTDNESQSFGVTVNHKLVHIERIVRELQKTGMLQHAVADQVAKFGQRISGHPRRQASARVREGKGFEFSVANVKDPFLSAEAQARAVDWIMRELYGTHDYYFTPSLDLTDEQRRIDEFLAGGESAKPPLRRQPDNHRGEPSPLL